MRSYTWMLALSAYVTLSLCLSVSWSLPAGGGTAGSSSSSSNDLDMDDLSRDRVSGQGEISTSQFQHMLAVRSPKYNFGLGKRRYIIEDVPGAKRLPHYNFGLGKRGSPMSGNDYEYDGLMGGNQLGWNDNDYTNLITKDGQFDYDAEKEKDAAKRIASGNGAGSAYRYHFGLGKRRAYDFGLGKRYFDAEDFNKRLPNRYNFGLGKR
uniref:Allatostatin 1 n=1 Tax=Anopheles arabiensis TaxID=7173 RepID=A0A1I8JU10_ANOAR